jgi:phosphinothricin acetyltransferase
VLHVTSIRPLTHADWPRVESILAAGIAEGDATFESVTPTWEQFDAGRLPDLRLVCVSDGTVRGWAAASRVSGREAYRGVIEHSVYVDPAARGRGVGAALLEALVAAADRAGYWTMQASIFPENLASLRLHERAGFRVVGTRERIARSAVGPRAGQWRSTVLVERRSPTAGDSQSID